MESNIQYDNRSIPISKRPSRIPVSRKEMAGYAAILLREFNELVETILLLDEKIVKQYNSEIDFATEQLNLWCENMTAENTLKMFFILRRIQNMLRNEEYVK